MIRRYDEEYQEKRAEIMDRMHRKEIKPQEAFKQIVELGRVYAEKVQRIKGSRR